MDAADDIAFLAGSEPRASVLGALYEEEVQTTDDLVDRSGAARVTVNRNLERLADRGLVVEDHGTYRLTALGSYLAEDFLSLVDTVETADHLEPLLVQLPAGSFDIDPGALADAAVTTSTPANPYAPAERHAETLETAEHVRQLLPAVSGQSIAASADRILAGDLEMEIVVTSDVAETLRTDLADEIAPLVDSEHHDSYVYDGAVPYFLGLVDGTVQIGVSDAEGIPRALAESDADRVRDWAEETYRDYRSAAEPFDLEGGRHTP